MTRSFQEISELKPFGLSIRAVRRAGGQRINLLVTNVAKVLEMFKDKEFALDQVKKEAM